MPPLRVLIVDDSRTVRRIVREELARIGPPLGPAECLEAEDGLAALETLRADPAVDLVISDWNMPRMNGLAFAQALRAIPPVAGVPILMMTVRRDKETVTAAIQCGVNGYLVKPFTGADLLEKVARLLKYRPGA